MSDGNLTSTRLTTAGQTGEISGMGASSTAPSSMTARRRASS